jgi:protein TonB
VSVARAEAADEVDGRDCRGLIACLLLAVAIHAGAGLALVFAFSPLPSLARLTVTIDIAAGAPIAPSPPRTPAPAAHPRATGAAPSPAPAAPARPTPAAVGAGSGGATGPEGTADAGAPPAPDWDITSPGKNRPPVFVVGPEMPPWVNRRGAALAVTVSFAISANGIVSGARIESSSGFPDVDSAVAEAIMMWHFRSDPSEGTVRATIRYVVKGHGPR